MLLVAIVTGAWADNTPVAVGTYSIVGKKPNGNNRFTVLGTGAYMHRGTNSSWDESLGMKLNNNDNGVVVYVSSQMKVTAVIKKKSDKNAVGDDFKVYSITNGATTFTSFETGTANSTEITVTKSAEPVYSTSVSFEALSSKAAEERTTTALTLDAGYYYIVASETGDRGTTYLYSVTFQSAATYSVTYKANNGTEEADVTDEAASSVAECSNTWTVPTGKTFNGWNTKADGTGDAYAVGATVSSTLTLYAQWANIATLFSMTSITGPTTDIASQGKASVTATFSTGGSAELFNANATNPALMVVSGYITLASSGNSYCHVSFPTKLQAGDVIALGETTGNAYLGTTSTKPGSKVVLPYTIPTNSSFVGATDLYIFNNKDDGDEEKVYQFNEFTVKGAAEVSNLEITSSTPVNLNIGGTSTITTSSSSTGDITFASSDANVATVSDEGVITAVNGGTATITISQAADDTYRAGATKVEVTVNETAIIKVKILGSQNKEVTGTIGGTGDVSVQSDKKFGSGSYAGFTLAGENTLHTGDVINVKITKNSTDGNGTIIIYDSDKSTILYNTGTKGDVGDNKFVLPEAVNGEKTIYICRTSSNGWNAYVDYIAVYRPNAIVPLNAAGYATYSNASNFEFVGAEAYGMNLSATALESTKVTSGKVAAGEGVLFKGNDGDKVAIFETDDAVDAIVNNNLQGTTPATGDAPTPDYANHKYFVLKGNQFVPYQTASTFAANKAYFEVEKEFSLNSIPMPFADETTAVEAVAEAKANFAGVKKFFKNGQLVIETANGTFTAAGAQVK